MTLLVAFGDLDAARTGDRCALDPVQESLISVSRKLGGLRSLECFASWLLRIVERECNRLKRGQRMPSGDVTHVALALEPLPAHYRDVVLLRDLEGLTIAGMAQRLHITREAVKSLLHRARALAREYLDP